MISRGAREAMNEIDEVAEEELDDQRKYQPRRDYYETALDEVAEYGTYEDLDRMKDLIIRSLKYNDSPMDKVMTYRKARNILKSEGNVPPAHSPLHRAGRTS